MNDDHGHRKRKGGKGDRAGDGLIQTDFMILCEALYGHPDSVGGQGTVERKETPRIRSLISPLSVHPLLRSASLSPSRALSFQPHSPAPVLSDTISIHVRLEQQSPSSHGAVIQATRLIFPVAVSRGMRAVFPCPMSARRKRKYLSPSVKRVSPSGEGHCLDNTLGKTMPVTQLQFQSPAHPQSSPSSGSFLEKLSAPPCCFCSKLCA